MPAREEPPRLLREFFISNEYDRGAAAMGPQIGAAHFEIKASVINILPSFDGFNNEDLYKHVDEFLYVCETVKISHVDDDFLRLRLFSFSLNEKAKY
ncbi:unnamed protein product [Victoria cruziana]